MCWILQKKVLASLPAQKFYRILLNLPSQTQLNFCNSILISATIGSPGNFSTKIPKNTYWIYFKNCFFLISIFQVAFFYFKAISSRRKVFNKISHLPQNQKALCHTWMKGTAHLLTPAGHLRIWFRRKRWSPGQPALCNTDTWTTKDT